MTLPEWITSLRSSEPSSDLPRAFGWATVDLDRAVEESGLTDWAPMEEPTLGARGLRINLGLVDLVLLEPSTEGRLAAWLARHGEGMAVEYPEIGPPRLRGG